MMRLRSILAAVSCSVLCSPAFAQDKDALAFEKAVLPIFEAKCFECHGAKKQRARLDLRTKTAILKGGESGAALKPGSLKGSLLWDKIRSDEMPEGDKKLTHAEKEAIRRWIRPSSRSIPARRSRRR